MMVIKIALMLVCVLTFAECQTLQDRNEANSFNSFNNRNRQIISGNDRYNENAYAGERTINTRLSDGNSQKFDQNSNSSPNRFLNQDRVHYEFVQVPYPGQIFPNLNARPTLPSRTTTSYRDGSQQTDNEYKRTQRPLRPSSQSNEQNSQRQPPPPPQQQPSTVNAPKPTRPRPNNSADDRSVYYQPIKYFAWQLFKNLNTDIETNYVSCPLAPQLLLSYLSEGSDGETKHELTQALGYDDSKHLNKVINNMLRSAENRDLQFATSFFVANEVSLNKNFAQSVGNNVEIVQTDFHNPEIFNRVYANWVNQKTKGALQPVRANFPPTTRMIMSTAVYFKGQWIFKFNPAQPGTFYENGSPTTVNMMNLKRKMQYGKVNDIAEWVALPYESSDMMAIILPSKGSTVDDVMQRIQIKDLFDAFEQDTYANVNLTLPKFKVESKVSLVKPLKSMGIQKIFSPNAEITRLTNEPLEVSNAIQQASLEINENGSIATSLTSFSVVALSFTPPIPDIEFTVDRPFIAMIVDKNGNFPYFIAKIVSPK